MNDNVICEKCGRVMTYYRKAGSCGYECPNCGWGWATSYYSPLDLDEQKYTVTVAGSNVGKSQQYKAISEILNCNYLEARKKYISGFSIQDIPAKDALSVIKTLTNGHVSFTVSPVFPHEYKN